MAPCCRPRKSSSTSRLHSSKRRQRSMGWAIIGIVFITWLTLVILFTPRIDYRITTPLRPDSDDFLRVIQWTCQASVVSHNRVEIFSNGAQFYPAMRDEIRKATESINMEAYIFRPGDAVNL